jgi:hypothetical protein
MDSIKFGRQWEQGHKHCHDTIRPPYVTVLHTVSQITNSDTEGWVLGKDYNIVVSSIAPSSPAAKSTLKVGDYILSIDGITDFNTENSMRAHLHFNDSGKLRKSGSSVLLVAKEQDGHTLSEKDHSLILEYVKQLKQGSNPNSTLPDGVKILLLPLHSGVAWGEKRTWLGAKLSWVPVDGAILPSATLPQFGGMMGGLPMRRNTT